MLFSKDGLLIVPDSAFDVFKSRLEERDIDFIITDRLRYSQDALERESYSDSTVVVELLDGSDFEPAFNILNEVVSTSVTRLE